MSAAEDIDSVFSITKSIAQCVPYGGTVSGVIGAVGGVVQLIVRRIEAMNASEALRTKILSSINDLLEILKHLKKHDQVDFPPIVHPALIQLENAIRVSTISCNTIVNKCKAAKFLNSPKHEKKLTDLHSTLKDATENLQRAFTFLQVQMLSKIEDTLETDFRKIGNLVSNPEEGIVINDKHYTALKPPIKPTAKLNDQKTGMIVTWIDNKNERNNVLKYEVMINPVTQQIISFLVEKLNPPQETDTAIEPQEYSISIFPPVVKEEQLCEIKVRAVNGTGPSGWSKVCPFNYCTGRPPTPKITSIMAISSTEVELEFEVKRDENRPVYMWRIHYINISNHEATDYESIHDHTANFPKRRYHVEGLERNTRYRFKVFAVNSNGTSPESNSKVIHTNSFLPGPPTEIKHITPFSENSISLRWNEPKRNADGLHQYRIRHMKKSKGVWLSDITLEKTTKEYTIPDLKPDAIYLIYFESMNKDGASTLTKLTAKTIKRPPKLSRQAKETSTDSLSMDYSDEDEYSSEGDMAVRAIISYDSEEDTVHIPQYRY